MTVLADLDGALSHSMLEKAVKMINIVMEQSTRTISKEAILLKKVTSPNNKLYCLISMDTDKYTVIKQATLEKKDILVPGIAEIMLHEWLLRLKKREKNVVIGCTFPDAPSARAPDWICNLESASEDNFSTVGTGNSASMHLKKAQCLGSARMQMAQTLHVSRIFGHDRNCYKNRASHYSSYTPRNKFKEAKGKSKWCIILFGKHGNE